MSYSKNLCMILTLTVLGLLLVGPSWAQETQGEPETPAQETQGEPETPAQETPGEGEAPVEKAPALTVYATICTAIEDREPVGAGESFLATVGQLYCHTLIEGAPEPTSITHVWYRGEEKMAEVILSVNSARWRTWSSKKIVESWTGNWHVDILGEDGQELAAVSFQIQ